MSKVICEICGTAYPETSESCPICGYARDLELEEMMEDVQPQAPARKGGKFAAKKGKDIFDYDEANDPAPDDEDEDFEEEEEEQEEGRSGSALIVVLVIIIMLLLAAAGFIFFKFFLPNLGGGETVPPTTQAPIVTQATTEETTLPTIPCQSLVVVEGKGELASAGELSLLHVKVMPEDTTDELIYQSEDESVATVSEDGRITAVGEGSTVINIICGTQQISFPVTVDYSLATEATESEETIPPVTSEDGDAAEETGAAEETKAEENQDAKPVDPSITLKLKKTDVMLQVPYGFTLELDCNLKPEDVEWTVEHAGICSVNDQGFVTALTPGTTAIIVKYGDQTVQCIVRCYMG